MPYDPQSEYIKHNAGCDCDNPDTCSCSSDCGCCPVGTVSVYDECGKHVGCLTPNDAAQYSVDTIDVPEGYVKVFDGDTYVGILTVADYCEYLECTGQAPAPETVTTLVDNLDGSFTYTSEDATVTTFAETLTTLVSDGNPLTPTYTYTSEDATVTAFTIPNTISLFSPVDPITYNPLAVTYNSLDGNNLSADIFFNIDRNGYTGDVTIELVSVDGIEFASGGTTKTIVAAGSAQRDEYEKPGAPLVSGTYNATLNFKRADGVVMVAQALTFIVP